MEDHEKGVRSIKDQSEPQRCRTALTTQAEKDVGPAAFTRLPNEVIDAIIGYLPARSIAQIRRVNTHLNRVVSDQYAALSENVRQRERQRIRDELDPSHRRYAGLSLTAALQRHVNANGRPDPCQFQKFSVQLAAAFERDKRLVVSDLDYYPRLFEALLCVNFELFFGARYGVLYRDRGSMPEDEGKWSWIHRHCSRHVGTGEDPGLAELLADIGRCHNDISSEQWAAMVREVRRKPLVPDWDSGGSRARLEFWECIWCILREKSIPRESIRSEQAVVAVTGLPELPHGYQYRLSRRAMCFAQRYLEMRRRVPWSAASLELLTAAIGEELVVVKPNNGCTRCRTSRGLMRLD